MPYGECVPHQRVLRLKSDLLGRSPSNTFFLGPAWLGWSCYGRRLIETGEPGEPGVAGGYRAPSLPYLARITTAAEDFGFEGALTPTGVWCDDAWVVTSMLSQLSERLKLHDRLPARARVPTLAAQFPLLPAFTRSVPYC